MSRQIQLRRGTTAEHSAFTGAVGEVTVDTTKDTAVVHDGSTVGGFPLLRESAYTAADVLTKIKTVDGSGSGLDADLLDGKNAADTGVNTIVQRNASGNALALGSATGTSFNSITGLASVAPVMDGTATVGTSPLVARQDHIHPSDTSKISTADIMMAVGNINSPLLDMPLKNSLAMKAGVGSATFTRASTATYVDRYGVLKSAAIDEPRFEKEGYLNEGTSTNLAKYSNDFTNAVWTKTNIVVTPNFATAPDGTMTASRVAGTGISAMFQLEASLSGVTATISMWIKSNNAGKDSFRLLGGGGVALNDTIATTEWVRYSGQFTGDGTDNNGLQQNSLGADFDLLVWGVQVEALPFATSYIPTVASAVTRSGDVLSVTYENNAPGNTEDVSYVVEANFLGTRIGSYQCIFEKNHGLYNLFRLDTNIDGYYMNVYLTPNPSLISMTGSSISEMNRFAIVIYKDGTKHTSKLYRSGIEKNTLTGFTYNNTNAAIKVIGLGVRGNLTSDRLFGHISNFRIYDKALSSKEIALA